MSDYKAIVDELVEIDLIGSPRIVTQKFILSERIYSYHELEIRFYHKEHRIAALDKEEVKIRLGKKEDSFDPAIGQYKSEWQEIFSEEVEKICSRFIKPNKRQRAIYEFRSTPKCIGMIEKELDWRFCGF